jgi:MFS family permease
VNQVSTPTEKHGLNPWPTFVVTAIAAYISTLDLSIVNVAFAEIAADFPTASRGTVSWVVTAYSILFGSLLVVFGRLADRVGRKKLFQFGALFFLAGSVMCAVAPTMGVLIAGRAVQGVGGAIMTPASLGLLLSVFSLERRSQAVAWNGAVGALGVASGPTLGDGVLLSGSMCLSV